MADEKTAVNADVNAEAGKSVEATEKAKGEEKTEPMSPGKRWPRRSRKRRRLRWKTKARGRRNRN